MEFIISKNEQNTLLIIAAKTIINILNNEKKIDINEFEITDILKTKTGAFVTLHRNEKLQGCIGMLISEKPLFEVIQDMAESAAFKDPRFMPVTKDIINELTLEISVLSPLKKINSIDEFELGKHGIYIKQGFRSGTFLPQVADETNWTKEEFISNCSAHKAGLGYDGWKTAELFTYTATIFNKKFIELI